MNTLPSDTNESVVDIFVLCGSSSVASPLKNSLEEGGYRVTIFTDGSHLLDSLQAGIPNLLICDATADDTAGYDACRQIKADDNLWMIPVLILSRTKGLADLLSVLDCNADNFIPYPCEPPFLISLIEGMLVTPVERQTPEMVKTQFRIQHDEKVYVVTADRRKLLELLLSSFETAVSISSDHSQTRDEAHQLSREGAELREKLKEQTSAEENLRESLRKKEQNERALTQELERREEDLAAKTGEINRLEKDLEDDRALIAAAEEHIRTMLQQKDATTAMHLAEATAKEQQLSTLSAELDAKKTDADRLARELEFQTTRCAGYESTLGEVLPQKEAAENALCALTAETEQLRTALSEERDRVASVSGELEKTRSAGSALEQDLGREIAGLKETIARQQSALDQLKSELGVETKRAITAYESFTSLQSEKEKSETALRTGLESLKQQLEDVTTELDATNLALKEEEQARMSAEAGFAQAASDKERLDEQIRESSAALADTRAAVESGGKERAALEQDLTSVSEELKHYEESYRNATHALEEAQSELDEEKTRNEAVVEQAEASIKEKEEAARELNEALDVVKRDLAAASARLSTLETDLKNALRVNEEAAESHRTALDSVTLDLDTRNSEMKQLRQALLGATTRITELEDELKAASRKNEDAVQGHLEGLGEVTRELESRSAELLQVRQEAGAFSSRIRDLEEGLRAAARSSAESGQKARSLGEELEQLKADLSNERRLHREDAEKLRAVISEKEALETEFSQSGGRLEETGTALTAERDLRITAEEQALAAQRERERISGELERVSDMLRRQEHDYSVKIEDLSSSLVQAIKEQGSLGKQLECVTLEKSLAEGKLASLAAEIEQARTALADEWEDHMNADEKLAVASESSIQLRQAEERLDAMTTELQQARTALADEWEDHMNANERLEELNKQERSRDTEVKETTLRRADVLVRDSTLPVMIRPKSTSLAKVDIPPLHPVHTPDEPTPGYGSESPAGTASLPDYDTDRRTAADIPLEDLFEDPEPQLPQAILLTGVPSSEEFGSSPETGEQDDVGLEGESRHEEKSPDEENDDSPAGYSTGDYSPGATPFAFNRQQWFDLFTWARHAEALTADQRMEIIRMGRLIQRGRKLTRKQDARIREMIDLVQSLGYHLT